MKNKRILLGFEQWKGIFLVLALSFAVTLANAGHGDLQELKSLKGNWKFSIGEREEWQNINYDDSDWTSVRVPAPWENEGFHGYNGFGTYRKKVNISSEFEGFMLYLVLGYIDDVDEVYFNGVKIGSTGSFPPHYKTAYNAWRKYHIPEEIINYKGLNQITVKVYDAEQAGGIVSGDIGIFSSSYGIKPDINLQGNWKFRTGDNFNWMQVDYNDNNWDKIFVPAYWENQGYRNYNGHAWYRRTFKYNQSLDDKMLVLLIGKIDDGDQVYINGDYVGSTALENTKEGDGHINFRADNAFRGYYFKESLLKPGTNVITVRVYDAGGLGGIYEGPIGIVTQKKHIEYWRKKKEYNKRYR